MSHADQIETSRIADQLRRAFEGEAWHGPSVLEILSGVGRAAQEGRGLTLLGAALAPG